MIKPLLATSLALNLGLLAFLVGKSLSADHDGSIPAGKTPLAPALIESRATPAGASGAEPPVGRIYFDAKPGAKALAQRLHRDGWPDYLIKGVIQIYVAKSIDAEMAVLIAKMKERHWDKSGDSEIRQLQEKLIDRQQKEIADAMVGIPDKPWASANANNAARYGNLTDDQIARAQRIESDYQALGHDETFRNKTARERDLIMGNLARERRADLVKALGEEGYFDYMARGSTPASHLKLAIQDLGIDEQQYRALFREALAWDEKYQNASSDPLMRQEAEIARQKNTAGYEQVLGAQKFMQFLERRDSTYRTLSGDMGRMNFPPSDSLALWKIVSDANLQIRQIQLDLDRGQAVDPRQANMVALQAMESARRKFGTDAFANYLANNPRWLEQLGAAASRVKKAP
jgi:hypothetical protein